MAGFILKQGWTAEIMKDLEVSGNISVRKNSYEVHFNICEPSVRAVNSGYNQKVWEDSCVELFLSFDGVNYYNFEINCVGSVLGAYGKERNNREFLDESLLKLIKVKSSLGKIPFGTIDKRTEYTVDVKIPSAVFAFNKDADLKSVRGNIYKCADRSLTPHYMYLRGITTEKPDFHRPEHFTGLF